MHPIINQIFIGLKKKEFDDELKSVISEKFFDEFIQMMYANLNQVKYISYKRKKIQNVLYFDFIHHRDDKDLCYPIDRIMIPSMFYKPKRYSNYELKEKDKKEKIEEDFFFDKEIYDTISVAYDLIFQGQEFNKDYYTRKIIKISLDFENKKVESIILLRSLAGSGVKMTGLQNYFSPAFIEESLNYKIEKSSG